jgi:hypothetical protein
MATAAKSDCGSSGETESLPFLVHDFKIAFHANGAVAEDSHFCACHECLRESFFDLVSERVYKISVTTRDYKHARWKTGFSFFSQAEDVHRESERAKPLQSRRDCLGCVGHVECRRAI